MNTIKGSKERLFRMMSLMRRIYFSKVYNDVIFVWEDESASFDALQNDYFANGTMSIIESSMVFHESRFFLLPATTGDNFSSTAGSLGLLAVIYALQWISISTLGEGGFVCPKVLNPILRCAGSGITPSGQMCCEHCTLDILRK
ncbi:hypothetical protein MKW98_012622 [Papaver atlanticum]|uniref:Uncharacterized protein n=1 Tax=Papaver atlanticum TaxID=357466 RepID=A0AAD4T272_9MAGN|nr:hypothetical protein MKW98_012622 [Papaver atlanticum]